LRPKDDHSWVLGHILLGVDLECARQAHTEAAESPADHCGAPFLAAVHIGETLHHLNGDGAARRKAAMSGPQAHSLGSDLLHASRDGIQRLISAHAAPAIWAAIITNLRVQRPAWIAKYLACGAAAHTKKPWRSGLPLSPLAVFSFPSSTSTNIPQNVGWQFMGHMVRTTLGAVMAFSTSGTREDPIKVKAGPNWSWRSLRKSVRTCMARTNALG
jgi:hypothetical protein